jgi:DNA-binding response OmpR family regulator
MMVKVLIVDDDAAIRRMLTVALENDFEILSASNGLEALEKNIINQPSVIISDLKMPIMDGFELLAKISNLNRPTPVIIMTGKRYIPAEDDHWLKSRLAFRGMIKKPFDLKELRSKIEAVLKAS